MATATRKSLHDLIFPEVAAADESVGGPHPTAGLAGFPARDFFAPPGTAAVAPESGRIVRLSGEPTTSPPRGPGKSFGLSEYLLGQSGTTYFITHLGTTTVKPGQVVLAGQQIGTVADFGQYGVPSHLHIGTSGSVGVDQLAQAEKIGFPANVSLPDILDYDKNHPYSGGQLRPENATGPESVDSLSGLTHGLVVGGTGGIGGGLVKDAANAAKDTVSAFTGIGSFFSWISKGKNWKRVGEVLLGSLLMLIGVVMLGKASGASSPVASFASAARSIK